MTYYEAFSFSVTKFLFDTYTELSTGGQNNMKRAFLGANSGSGFVSHFDGILGGKPHGKLIILKGGSGCGKSTLMKKAAEFAATLNMDCELYPCSSDVDSLDGVYIEKLNAAIVDGTSPHVVEPPCYGASGMIVNLGDVIRSGITSRAAELGMLIADKKRHYRNAYAYLAAAKTVYEVGENNLVADGRKAAEAAEVIMSGLDVQALNEEGIAVHRKMFLSGYSAKGLCDFYGDMANTKNITVLTGGTAKLYSDVILRIYEVLGGKCSRVNLFYSPLDLSLSGVYLYDFDAFITADCGDALREAKRLDLSAAVKGDREFLLQTAGEADVLVNYACCAMKDAFDRHLQIEAEYRSYVDFEKVNVKIDEVLKILQS